MKHTIIIAEVGENHIGKIEIAKKLIEDAASAKADYVKFQSYSQETFYKNDPEYEWFKKVSLSNDDHFLLHRHAQRCGVNFLSAPFSLERAKFLCEDLGLREVKVASGMMLNFKILDYFDSLKLDTVFLSTGMANLEEVERSLEHLKNIKRIYLLHCVTQYPCKDEEANLKAISALCQRFKLPVGYSDHTIGIEACLAAIALGAEVIENHFTFERMCIVGTDHEISVEASELRHMIDSIRRIEKMLGSAEKKPSVNEEKIVNFVRNRFIG
jgi:sialic acid synthase SpsE